MNQVLNEHKQQAVRELEEFLDKTEALLSKAGWKWYPTDCAPETFNELQRVVDAADGVMPIAAYGCDKTVYSSAQYNMKMRFWHDVCHLGLGLDFTPENEMVVIAAQLRSIQAAGLSELAQHIFFADFAGQVRYYQVHGEFVDNQDAFVDSCLRHGLENAVKVKH